MGNLVKTAGMLIIKDGKVLLVRHTNKASHLTGVCGLPAGRLEESEDFIDCAIRELEEETGLIAEREDLIAIPEIFVSDIVRKDDVVTMSYQVFLCRKYSGELKSSDENICFWVDIDKLEDEYLLPNIEKIVELGLKLME